MIRRRMGGQFLLIPQDSHAQLSGKLVEHLGNEEFARPEPEGAVIAAVGLHDCGWGEHDAHEPGLNPDGLPTDVFENPLMVSLRLWEKSVEGAAAAGPYAQLLVSLHVLGLSGMAAGKQHDRREVFELNRFQHGQAERQVSLRRRLGMSVDEPLRLGLAVRRGDSSEEQLRRNHGIMQIMDRLSLGVCCTELPFNTIDGVIPRPRTPAVTMQLTRPEPRCLTVAPWPFDMPVLEVGVSGRTIPVRKFADAAQFHAAYADAAEEKLELVLRPG